MIAVPDRESMSKIDTDIWIEERFLELGFNHLQAEALREARADWHQAERMLDQGCSHEHATLILT